MGPLATCMKIRGTNNLDYAGFNIQWLPTISFFYALQKKLSITWVQISPSHAGGATEGSLGARLGPSWEGVTTQNQKEPKAVALKLYVVGIGIYWGTFLESDFCQLPLHLISQNVLKHLYFDKAQTAWPMSTRQFRNIGKSSTPISSSKIKAIHRKTRLYRSKKGEKRITCLHPNKRCRAGACS